MSRAFWGYCPRCKCGLAVRFEDFDLLAGWVQLSCRCGYSQALQLVGPTVPRAKHNTGKERVVMRHAELRDMRKEIFGF